MRCSSTALAYIAVRRMCRHDVPLSLFAIMATWKAASDRQTNGDN